MEVTYHFCKNIVGKSYHLCFTDENNNNNNNKLWLREYSSCRVMRGIEYIYCYHFCALLIPGKIFSYKTRMMSLTSESELSLFFFLPAHTQFS